MARKTRKQIEAEKEAAKAAADELVEELGDSAFESPEDRDITRAIHEQNLLSEHDNDAKDIFAEGKRKAIARNTSVQFRIYRDGSWVGTKPASYTWEKLRNDFKSGGHFKVVAIDRDNQFMGSQSLEVAGIEEESQPIQQHNDQSQQSAQASALQMMELMKENQREAEAKAASQQGSLATLMATVMQSITQGQQTMMQIQQQSSQQFQTLLLEMQKQNQAQSQASNDRMMTLVTTLLTQKPQTLPESGVKYEQVLKLISDAETRAENRVTKQYEMIEKKADALADVKAAAMSGNDEDESFGKTVIKGFMPVLSQMIAQPRPTPEQMAVAQMEESRRLNPALHEGFVEGPSRPAIPARDPRIARSNDRAEGGPQPRPQAAAPAPRPRPQPITVEEAAAAQVQMPNPQPLRSTASGGIGRHGPKDSPEISRIKKQLFDFCVADIGQGMMEGQSASKVAELCLSKLEKEGVPRQTVAISFELDDFYGYADQYGLPEQAKPWLKEFHEAIRTSGTAVGRSGASSTETGVSRPTSDPVAAKPAAQPTVAASEPVPDGARNAQSSNGAAAKPVPKTVGPRTRASGARTRSGEPAKNI